MASSERTAAIGNKIQNFQDSTAVIRRAWLIAIVLAVCGGALVVRCHLAPSSRGHSDAARLSVPGALKAPLSGRFGDAEDAAQEKFTVEVTGSKDVPYLIRCVGTPRFVRPLPYAPVKREDYLNHGTWLVMAVAVWSTSDVLIMKGAVEAVIPYGGRVKLGLRPFDRYDELSTWVDGPILTETPVWLVIQGGATKEVRRGPLSSQELKAWLDATLADKQTKLRHP